jgi:hypothetical protein
MICSTSAQGANTVAIFPPGGERRVVAAIPGRAAAAGPGLPAVLSLAGRAVRLPASAGGLTGNMVKAT